jgi:hypothetical protein
MAATSPPDFRDGTTVYSPWAVVTYLLAPPFGQASPVDFADPAQQVPLWTLYRLQQVAADPRPNGPMQRIPGVSQWEFASGGTTAYYPTGPKDVTVPEFRPVIGAQSITNTGEEVLLTNVISFQVQATWLSNPTLFGLQSPAMTPQVPPTPVPPGFIPNPDYPWDDIPQIAPTVNSRFGGQRFFDTWSSINAATFPQGTGTPVQANGPDYTQWASQTWTGTAPQTGPDPRIPLRIRVRALKITIRVWDPQTQQARQVTIIQDV